MTANQCTLLPHIDIIGEFQFHYFDFPIPVVRAADGHLYAAMIAICHIFNLNETEEVERLLQHNVFHTQLAQATFGGIAGVIVMRISYLSAWLLSLPITGDLTHWGNREELRIFQCSASQILEEAFLAGRLSTWPLVGEMLDYDAPEVSAYKEILVALGVVREALLAAADNKSLYRQYDCQVEGPC